MRTGNQDTDTSSNFPMEQSHRPSDLNGEKLRSVFIAAPIGIGVVSGRTILEVNDMICAMTGFSRDELIGKNARFLYPSIEEFEQVGTEQQRQVSGNGPGWTESRWQRKDGTIIDVLLTSAAIDRNDTSKGFTITAQDITQKKKAEQKINEQNRILQQMSGSLPGILYQFYADRNGGFGFNYISSKSEELFGLKNELPGFFNRFVSHIPEECRNGFLSSIRRAVEEASTWSYVWPFMRDDGETLWFKGTSNPVAYGEQVIFDGMALDITDRVEFETALKESEEKYRNLVELAVDGILLGSHEGIIMEVNSGMEVITGHAKSFMIGKKFDDLFTPEVLQRNPLRTDLLIKGETVIREREITRDDGSVVSVEIRSRMMPDRSYQSIFRDITGSRRLMENMQRTLKLESLATLTGGIAHDFNNLLAGIAGYIDLARRPGLGTDELNSCLDRAMTIFDRARSLTTKLATFASGGEPVLKRGNIAGLLKEYADSAMKGSDIHYRLNIGDDLWECMIDSVQIGQVIYAIVTNAREFSPAGGEITISAGNIVIDSESVNNAEPGRYVMVSISDMGRGISPEILQHIFDPFFTTKNTGNGLGMATSYSIITRHKGIIDVESAPGRGSTVFFYLPAAETAHSPAPENIRKAHRGKGLVLVMDDEQFIRDITSQMLISMGYDVVTADGGSEVLEILSRHEKISDFRFILLDLTIPGGMGGRDTAAAIRRRDRDIPLFAASGYSIDPVMADPVRFGFTGSIRKPFRINDLSEFLNSHISCGSQPG